ncbi:hypothetical protein H6F78_03395 [Coleofasciculus sp. FACHB-64]|uniref:DUF6193 family natural product biosynthesis protein n=1 Tax=Cyanophyceae TaxID=3028117 RepID=UPI001682BC9B|nr:hypothetical protein [Coleofasciculus sp. FACHB-501]MBD2044686.1 hypothetical protein [Coleofasciculus sp. FACHB-64]
MEKYNRREFIVYGSATVCSLLLLSVSASSKPSQASTNPISTKISTNEYVENKWQELEQRWQEILQKHEQRWQYTEQTWENNQMPPIIRIRMVESHRSVYDLVHLIQTARRHSVLGQLYPYTSHYCLGFSRYTEPPFWYDCPAAVPTGKGQYEVLAPSNYQQIIAIVNDAPTAISLIVENLPRKYSNLYT